MGKDKSTKASSKDKKEDLKKKQQEEAKKKAKEESSSDSSSEESSSEESSAPAPAPKGKAAPVKKEESSDDSSDDSSEDSSEDSSSSEEKPAKKEAPKKKEEPKQATKTDAPKQVAKKEEPKKAAKKEESSEEESSSEEDSSDDESSSESEAPKQGIKRKADSEAAQPAKKQKTEAAASPAQSGGVEGGRKLFVSNLSWNIDDDGIRKFFEDDGELTDIKWNTDRETGRFRGSGFIEFATPEAAASALKKNGNVLMERPIRLELARERPGGERGAGAGAGGGAAGGRFQQREMTPKPEGCTTVFLGNLSFNIDEDTIRKTFSDCGEIVAIRWVEKDGTFKGCGFVEFADESGPDKAIKFNGENVLGRDRKSVV